MNPARRNSSAASPLRAAGPILFGFYRFTSSMATLLAGYGRMWGIRIKKYPKPVIIWYIYNIKKINIKKINAKSSIYL